MTGSLTAAGLKWVCLAAFVAAVLALTVFDAGATPVEGVTCGLDAAGFLRVREDNGAETTILAGGVRPL